MQTRFSRRQLPGGVIAWAIVLGGMVSAVSAAPLPQRLSRFTNTTYSPDGEIFEFISFPGNNQEYFIIDPGLENPPAPNFGAIKVGSILTPGVFVARDNSPTSAGSNSAGQTGFRDRPGAAGLLFLPTGFNIGRTFVSYNPDAYDGEGAYFLAMDISAPGAMDSVVGTQPVAFDVDGDGSRLTQTEINPGAVPEAPTRINFPDTYAFEIDTNGDGKPEVAVVINERRGGIRVGSVAIDPGGVPQNINGVVVRRSVFFDDVTATLPGTSQQQALMFLDANNDGVLDHNDIGVGTDLEIVVRNVRLLPNALHSACARFTVLADTFDDEQLGGGGEDLMSLSVNFPVPDLEVKKEARCVDGGSFADHVRATPGSQVEFRVTIQNHGNRDLDVTLDDTLGCLGQATAALVPGSCQIVGDRPLGVGADFCNRFQAALSSNGFPMNVGILTASDDCALVPGQPLVFTYRVTIGPTTFQPTLCDNDIDCTNRVSVTGRMTDAVDPILPPIPLTPDSPDGNAEEQDCDSSACCNGIPGCNPNDGVGDVPDEFFATVVDQHGVTDTDRERSGNGDDNIVTIEVECRGINLTKEVRLLPDGQFQKGLDPARLPAAPVDLEYRYSLVNNGELDESATITEGSICADVASLIAGFPGQVSFGTCPICTGPTPGRIDTVVPAGGNFQSSCVIRFTTTGEPALRAFMTQDDNRTACRALTPGGLPDRSCYRNCAQASAQATNLGDVCPDGSISSESFATVCHEACDLSIVKQARCLSSCTQGSAVGGLLDELPAIRGTCVQFETSVTNTSADTSMCALRITDTLSQQPANIVFNNNVRFRVGAATCPTPAAFNVNGVPFTWNPTDCGLSGLSPGESLVITYDARIPDSADPAISPENDVLVEGAAFCPASGPSITCMGAADATIDIRRPGLTCTDKQWAFQSDHNADCQPEGSFGAFTTEADLRDELFPVVLKLRIRAQNTGDVALTVTANDTALTDCVNSVDGAAFVAPACELATSKPVAPGATIEWLCHIRVDAASAMRALDTCDGAADGVYNNTASVSGTISEAGGICLPTSTVVPGDSTCSARILVPPPCQMTVDKHVKCGDQPDGTFTTAADVTPGSTETFRVRVNNTSNTVNIPQVCLTDVLTCRDFLVPGSITALIGATDVTPCVAPGLAMGLPSGSRKCFTFAACRPAQPWIGPTETLTITFDVAVPSSFSTIGQDPDCRNTITVDSYDSACQPEPPADRACSSGIGSAQFDVLVPRLECVKEVCADRNHDGICDEPYARLVELPTETDYPVALQYRFMVRNSGEIPLTDVQICDEPLFADASAAGFTPASCQLDGLPGGCSTGESVSPNGALVKTCRLIVPSHSAWQTFAGSDSDNDEECYTNVGVASGEANLTGLCPGTQPFIVTSQGCSSQVCIEPPPRGACCRLDGTCGAATEEQCLADGDTYFGDNTQCLGDVDGDGVDDACQGEEPRIPTTSQWGLVILGLLMLTMAKIHFGTRRDWTVS